MTYYWDLLLSMDIFKSKSAFWYLYFDLELLYFLVLNTLKSAKQQAIQCIVERDL